MIHLKDMSARGNKGFDPAKIWKSPVFFPPAIHKPADIFSPFVKFCFALCCLASVSLCFYLILSCSSVPFSGSIIHRLNSAVDTPTDLTHILFGIGGSSQTWEKRRRYSDLWWRPNVTRGFVWLDKKPEKSTWPESSPPYKVSADTSRFKYTCSFGYRSAIRIARILKESFDLGLPNVRWFVLGDDDTVFFLENLVTVLNKYDHNQMYYVGGGTESVEQALAHSYAMAYGGGGFAISYPLAAELVKILDGCINRYASFYGSDLKIQSCISEIGVPLTNEPGFHQLDMRGSPYGYLAAHPLAPLVSLHHLDYLEPIYPETTKTESVKKLMTVYKRDPNRALQQSFCYDYNRNWTISISWGYTIQLYPFIATANELETPFLTFRTWGSWSQKPFTFNTRKVSEDACRKPLVYILDRSYEPGSSRTLTTYRRFVRKDANVCDYQPRYSRALAVQFFDVSAAKLDSGVWNKAPRRQCCDVMDGGDQEERMIEVKIRECKRLESVTPP